MTLVICPGAHPQQWTLNFLNQLDAYLPAGERLRQVFPAPQVAPWSAHALRQFLESQVEPTTPLLFIAFSAGCVAAMGVARYWTEQGGHVQAVIALDGWGVPVAAPFDTYRLSHDEFTHQTSTWLGSGITDFYADPPVSHQALWCCPAQVNGWQVNHRSPVAKSQTPTTALAFLMNCLERYPEAGRT